MRSSDALYGAFELKRSYQVHLLWGITLGAVLHIAATLSIPYLVRPDAIVTDQTRPGHFDTSDPIPLPRIEYDIDPPVAPTTSLPPAVAGIPVSAPDDEIISTYTPPNLEESPGGLTGLGVNGCVGIETDGEFGDGEFGMVIAGDEPLPGVFIPVESPPFRVKSAPPTYPEMARLTGREGKVVVRALVDRDGTVRRAEVVRPSGTNIGFDEAAVEAALQCRYKPAIQNGKPVIVWVTYVVEFKLR